MIEKVKLILADNEDIFREGLVKLLKSDPDIEVVSVCGTGLETIECIYKHQFDVLLMDMVIGLSQCNGIEVVRRIHEELPKTNIIMLTHSETDANLISVIRAGLIKHIYLKILALETSLKPFFSWLRGESLYPHQWQKVY